MKVELTANAAGPRDDEGKSLPGVVNGKVGDLIDVDAKHAKELIEGGFARKPE